MANINIRRRRHIAGGSTHSINLLDEELSKFVGVDVSWGGRRPLSRDKTEPPELEDITIFDLNSPLL